MKHKRVHSPPASAPLLIGTAAASGTISLRQSRLTKLGSTAAVIWYLGGFLLLFAGALLQVGPFAWAASWQVRHWGSDSVMLSFLPGFAVLAAPVVLLQLLPRRPDWPFLSGAQDAFSARRANPTAPPSPEYMARLLLRLARIGLALSVLFLIAGGVGYVLILHIGNRGAGKPLPELTLAAATAQALPGYARITGVAAHPEVIWVHDHAIRQTRYHDTYSPLTGPNWRQGDAVILLEEKSTVVNDDPAPAGAPNAGPIEGKLERGVLPGWMVSELRRAGVNVIDDPVVLLRRDLSGVVPGADEVGEVLALVFGSLFAFFSLAISLGWLHRRRKLLRAAAQLQ